MQISVAVPEEDGTQSTSRSRHSTLEHRPKDCFVLLQGHVLNHVHFCSIHDSQKLEIPIYPSIDEYIMKMWYIYTRELENNHPE